MDLTRLEQLIDTGRSLLTELDLNVVLQRLLEVARDVTSARYAAVGVLDEDRSGLERFITSGVDAPTHAAIGELPSGRGVLGVLITDPRPLRLPDVSGHPKSYGFPLAHPEMRTFLGVPITVRGSAWGNLYLTEKAHGEFTKDDEEAAVVLADWAAMAIWNARLHADVRARRDELERANRGLETTTEIARALGGLVDLPQMLELVVKRSRALVNARAAMLALIEGDEIVVATVAGEGVTAVAGTRLPLEGSLVGSALRTGRLLRVEDVPMEAFARREVGARTALVAPMIFHGRALGALSMFDRMGGNLRFTNEDERLLEAFAASAAAAVATAQNAGADALRRSIEASDEERRRWARELHDETLQQLAGLRVLLSGARRAGDARRTAGALDAALEQLTGSITDLRGLIADLRPAALDELGLGPALETLAARVRDSSSVELDLDVELRGEEGNGAERLAPDLESAAYRILQEALTNVTKHAAARRVAVRVTDAEGDAELCLSIRDDGQGFDPAVVTGGFGLLGMRERVGLAGGSIEVTSAPGQGTRITARLPVRRGAREVPLTHLPDTG